MKAVSNVWVSANNTLRFSGHWGMIADIHVRRKDFITGSDFYFLRTGVHYWFTKDLSMNIGYGYMWVMPATAERHTVAQENRIHEQLLLTGSFRRVSMLQRLRNEHRWVQYIANDKVAAVRYSDRVRCLLSLNARVFKSKPLPSLTISDELMVQFGKEIVYNTFDKNRIFIGVRQDITHNLSFNLGYMRIFQQKVLPQVYERPDVLRLFFYWSPDLRKSIRHKSPDLHHPNDE